MKTKEEVLENYQRRYDTNLDVGEFESEIQNLLDSKEYIRYYSNTDSINPALNWTCYGDFNKNRLWIVLEGLEEKKYGFVDSPLAYPVMRDRFMGIDMFDNDAVGDLVNIMCLMFEI